MSLKNNNFFQNQKQLFFSILLWKSLWTLKMLMNRSVITTWDIFWQNVTGKVFVVQCLKHFINLSTEQTGKNKSIIWVCRHWLVDPTLSTLILMTQFQGKSTINKTNSDSHTYSFLNQILVHSFLICEPGYVCLSVPLSDVNGIGLSSFQKYSTQT